ncbi:TerC/Alx family metal homeostasis membrane protein [Mycobacterium botniense]|uniref:Putative membrane protein n=1 Tax=Mycobacterium botniense TaxID=84962 RepID=A0A7I9Y2Q0_9MYCO|nr:TerC/Alx family metal homeostasis membrane protein [Mycobacterium botniense]GFG76348.1 putative membrane protein [Mycobacterium botniense]
MGVSAVVWALTVTVLVGLAMFDYLAHVRHAHVPTLREAALWSALFIGLAILFGIGVVIVGGTTMGVEYFACYLSNQALSVDNLFIFLVVLGVFAVPRVAQQKVLLYGVMVALVARTAFIFVGAALISVFDWAFYLFAAVLLITAGNLLRPSESAGHTADAVVIRAARRFLRTSDRYHRDRLFTIENGKPVLTPMLLVMVALAGTDLLFAFDSIPALFGLSRNVYVVFSATALSLLGLRQLYFLIDGLLDRLIYLPYGLAVILGFIGVKLMLQALHENNIPFINHGNPVPVADVSTGLSLVVITVILVVTTAASLLSSRGRAQHAVARARRHAYEYLDLNCDTDPAERERTYNQLLAEERQIDALPPKYRARIRHQDELTELLERAHRAHDAHNRG